MIGVVFDFVFAFFASPFFVPFMAFFFCYGVTVLTYKLLGVLDND